ncbi:membrane-anchored protein [Agrobacterium larrymoorei]|nr:membrane-anchored protein [Agrobacterium larrymoorei]
MVVGSAPNSTKPADFGSSYMVISINASQIVAKKWGVEKPDITLMMFHQIEGKYKNAQEVRRVLNGERTGHLCMLLWRHDLRRLQEGLARINYGYDALSMVDRYSRVALVRAMTGKLNFEISPESKYSNGVIAVMLALHSGAERVVISGINPASTGHVYNSENLYRKHSGPDLEALQHMQQKGLPVYTADPEVAKATGLPLWTGEV